MRRLFAIMLVSMLAGLASGPVVAGEAGDIVFANRGPWSLPDSSIAWTVNVAGPEAPGFLPVHDGSVTLAEIIDPSDQQPALQLIRKTDARSQKIGPFPISGGDPVLTFFLEQTSRDMARLTGGSPFYIRNRIKDAVFRGGQIARDGDSVVATFQPFAADPNAAKMNGFQTLKLTFVLDDPAAPIRELRAETEGDIPGYLNHMVLQ
ncbi:hypothetical protein [Paracoccus seriniphilus]|uniref:Uncharacterized protein n=1 Tax=Paracoccus seriniphilus TaxID=184748 RepID=A0A239PKX2_9RHOB|nr:hypothetical protein [Paracoccus seriniphilus]WCR13911.1 hypothetical protein JHW44_13585 [Paracoccus seriniphilus]SNT68461.1 hypothetical protein SAMN05444959_10114 [Paracoccus seriniphilus]